MIFHNRNLRLEDYLSIAFLAVGSAVITGIIVVSGVIEIAIPILKKLGNSFYERNIKGGFMIDNIYSIISSKYFLTGCAIVVGTALSFKILKMAIPIIKKIGSAVLNNALYVNLKSMFCNRCASLHRCHGNTEIDKETSTIKTIFQGQ